MGFNHQWDMLMGFNGILMGFNQQPTNNKWEYHWI
jgi:hypothetical protein